MSKQNKDKDINIGTVTVGDIKHAFNKQPTPEDYYCTDESRFTRYDQSPYDGYGDPWYPHRAPPPQRRPMHIPDDDAAVGKPLPPQPAPQGEACDKPKDQDQKPDHYPARKQPPMDPAGRGGYPPAPPYDEEAYGYPYPPPQHQYGYGYPPRPRHGGGDGYYRDGYPTVQGGGPHKGMGRIPAGVATAYDTYRRYREYGRHGGGDYGGGYRHGYGHQGKFKHAHQGKYSHYYGRHDGGYYN